MDKVFLTILNMSLTGGFVIAVICAARLLLKKAPKRISYCLWAVVGFRLLCPFSIESVFSLIPFKASPIPANIAAQPIPRIDSGIPFVNNAVSDVLPVATPTASVNPLQLFTTTGAWVWIAVVVALLVYGAVSFVILQRRMAGATPIEANIYEAENIKSPFVLGIFRPNIYLPTGLSEQEKIYIIQHEQTHIRRHDHIVKLGAYFILCLHWFNPLAWVAFLLMSVDMEMSCDEHVLKEMGSDVKKAYSLSLLTLAAERRAACGSPLAFGEGSVKARVNNILHFRKPSQVVITLSVALVVVLIAGFAVNKTTPPHDPQSFGSETYTLEHMTERQQMERMTSFTLHDDGTAFADKGARYISAPENNLAALSGMRTPYVGNNSAVGKIVNALPQLDEAYMQQYFSIGDDYGTNRAPYTLTIYYEPTGEKAGDIENIAAAPANSALLFALIDNLKEVTFAFRNTPSGGRFGQGDIYFPLKLC